MQDIKTSDRERENLGEKVYHIIQRKGNMGLQATAYFIDSLPHIGHQCIVAKVFVRHIRDLLAHTGVVTGVVMMVRWRRAFGW